MGVVAGPPWWLEVIKVGPGWAAFLWGIVAGVRMWRHRRAVAALGPAEKLRDALIQARTRFEDIAAKPHCSQWFTDEQRRETARHLRELAEQVGDKQLRDLAQNAADAWDGAFASSPSPGPAVSWTYSPPPGRSPEAQARAEEQAAGQAERAHAGIDSVRAAIVRLNELERRARGR